MKTFADKNIDECQHEGPAVECDHADDSIRLIESKLQKHSDGVVNIRLNSKQDDRRIKSTLINLGAKVLSPEASKSQHLSASSTAASTATSCSSSVSSSPVPCDGASSEDALEHEFKLSDSSNQSAELDDHKQQQQRRQSLAAEAKGQLLDPSRLTSRTDLKRSADCTEVIDSNSQSKTKSTSAVRKQSASQRPTSPAALKNQEIGFVKKLTSDCLLYLVKLVISAYDLISQPIYYVHHDVGKRRSSARKIRSRRPNPSDPNAAWDRVDVDEAQQCVEAKIDSFDTYDEMMRNSFEEHASRLSYGYRQILSESFSKQPVTGKMLRQVELSDYRWCTYGQLNSQIEAARRGFLLEGVKAGDKVMLYADTRAEWQIAAQALLRLGAVVCTMYSTLGVDGIIHTVNETKVTHVVTQHDKVERLANLREDLPRLKKIIYFEVSLCLPEGLGSLTMEQYKDGANQPTIASSSPAAKLDVGPMIEKLKSSLGPIECVCFTKLLETGLKQENATQTKELEAENRAALSGPCKRTKNSLAVIMYTSGSTGIPKGVLISHANMMATLKSFSYVTKDFVREAELHTCAAYLPLAHIFEFCIESVMLYHGVKYGFGTPHTLTSKSPGLKPGQSGDLILLRPTVMIMVPLILDRVVLGIKQQLAADSYFKDKLINYLIEYKIRWQKKHYKTPLIDRLVCSKIAAALGGRAKYVICGSAPLSSQTQQFVRAALNLNLPQGFGTTETCAATACQLFDDQSTQNVGLPVAGAKIKLEPWHEGNYHPTDEPNPRGEIVVGGEMIALGYFNLPKQTDEAFYEEKDARTGRMVRWYRTGDIGEMLPNGQLKIVDRKRDLVKLQNGEYISLGRVESILKSNPYTDNFCIFANSNFNYVVALGPANELALKNLAAEIVDRYEKESPSIGRRGAGLAGTPTERSRDEERENLVSDDEMQAAIEELREVLASYQSDELNNNCDPTASGRTRSGSSTSYLQCLDERLNRLCTNKLINGHILAHLCNLAKERNLLSLEVPKKLKLIAEDWTEDKNLVTAAMKIRRNFIYKRYERQLEQLYID